MWDILPLQILYHTPEVQCLRNCPFQNPTVHMKQKLTKQVQKGEARRKTQYVNLQMQRQHSFAGKSIQQMHFIKKSHIFYFEVFLLHT